jgi:hypothetical protein
MTDYFVCSNGNGSCENCGKKTIAVFGCERYGDCDYCIAVNTDFCSGCVRCTENKGDEKRA